MDVLSIDKEQEKRETQEVKQAQCKMCKGFFPASEIKINKCPECTRIYKEWQNGRKKTKEEKKKFKGVRAHYNIPYTKKVYSVYQYDQEKYNGIWAKIQELAFKYDKNIHYNTNPYRVLDLCYVRDNEGQRVHLKDEKHAYRYKALHRINALIAEALNNVRNIPNTKEALHSLYKDTGLIYYPDEVEPQADLKALVLQPLRIRLKVASRLLRLLYYDELSIKEAVYYALDLNRKLPREKLKPIYGVIKWSIKPKPQSNANEINGTHPRELHRIEWHNAVKEDITNGLRPCEVIKKHNIAQSTYYRLKKELEAETKQNEPRTKQEIQEKLGELMQIEHYYRLKTLGKITTAIAQELSGRYGLLICDDVINYLYKRTGIRYFKQEKLAEITAIYREAIRYRLEVHIVLLRLLREGYELEEIIELLEWQYKISEV